MHTIDRFRELAIQAGAEDLVRVVASAKTALINGDSVEATLDALKRNCPYLFKRQKARTESRRSSGRNYK